MSAPNPQELTPGLFRFEDTCNVYVLRQGDRGLAIDFGSGAWVTRLKGIGVLVLDHVILTHHHADQCAGLLGALRPACPVHAPVGEEAFLRPSRVREFWRRRRENGCPASYSVLPRGVPRIRYDMAEAADIFWQGLRVRFLPTPGHGPNAFSVILNSGGKQIVFCGDAAHAGATVWQPFHLEWHHSTAAGALAAWAGVARLAQVGMDLLCPSHGPVVSHRPADELKRLLTKLMKFHRSKLSICPGERDEFLPAEPFGPGAMRVLPNLYHFGVNGFLLLAGNGEALVVDPTLPDMEAMERLCLRLRGPRITAAIASHFHCDHVDAIPLLQAEHGTRAFLHPAVAKPIEDAKRYDLPWLPSMDIRCDDLLPEDGIWQWNEYRFRVAHFPGQTWWHAAHQVEINGVKVFFGGDNFQPNSRWNGTGGYCSFNGSRFREGFLPSVQLVLDWAPDVFCNGHGAFFRFRPARLHKIRKWAVAAEAAVADLCPTGDLETDYYMHDLGEPLPCPERESLN